MHPNPNKFLTFLFSLVPGAGHMYLGLLKRGGSFMAAFFSCIAVVAFADRLFGDVFTLIFALLLPVIWFVAFFDFWRCPRMSEEERAAFQDEYLMLDKLPAHSNLFKSATLRKARVVFGVVLILAGLQRLYHTFIFGFLGSFLHSDRVRDLFFQAPTYIGALAIIAVGLLLIFWKARQIRKEASVDEE